MNNPATKSTKKAHNGFQAGYLSLLESDEVAQRVRISRQHMQDCDLCARYCHVDRLQTIQGAVCRIGERAVVYSYGAHHGEEDVLRGWNGSGTIFSAAVICVANSARTGTSARRGLGAK